MKITITKTSPSTAKQIEELRILMEEVPSYDSKDMDELKLHDYSHMHFTDYNEYYLIDDLSNHFGDSVVQNIISMAKEAFC